MNFVFKIFGIPHVFDLHQGNEDEKKHFLTFDNGSRENTKLVIHRMENGWVSYSYLRYNFITSDGHDNSWFGMSVMFENAYCRDIENLFELFDTVYKDVILKNGKLLTTISDDPKAQAKYLVRTFAEANGEVKLIESNIINNLKKYFADDILPLNSSFTPSYASIKLNSKVGNTAFLEALREYSHVSISPEYKNSEEIIFSPEAIAELDNLIEKNKKLNNIQTQLSKLNDALWDIRKELNASKSVTVSPPTVNPPPISILLWHKHKLKIIGLATVLVLLMSGFFIFQPWQDKNHKQYTTLLKRSDSLLSANPLGLNNIDEAIKLYEIATTLDVAANNAQDKIRHAKQTAIDMLKTKAGTEFNKGGIGNTPKIAGYDEAVKQLLLISEKGYGNADDYSNIIEEYKQGTIDYYFEEVDKDIPIENKKKYLEYILELDPSNKMALYKMVLDEKKHEFNKKNDSTSKREITQRCYVNIPGYGAKRTVDELLQTLEYDLTTKRRISLNELQTLRVFCDMIINNKVGCPVSYSQKHKAKELKEKEPRNIEPSIR
ncbi:hypothetical protein M2459_000240 [Parabacteroides sp. PF5-5]|uniref:hypothetical protein n=1 Tax=unclassified Parabacteroides TaxID=2649774 RepID=UPI00247728AF|nr:MULTISPECIES: hypothetical protein [unclassified Parabacteroides]MDH6303908.1 hypothetical protein [Parabacteroides sp. PH5-39]MDH6314525.1 hypothetical protein [Parabacteroides sp. PF5-13]MDH6318410.1 hypothetical protein [Parabacteroides sp. PH5-13]MDH6322297.1 hypothetical protein [Parabacteroides sp. PH5-8]MDH6325623.1 hypothetical protein [Parabacteroides sp. PH5-41]